MRSRSSRLFIVLLHLVGVSTNLPRRKGSHVGIVGVNPMAILLERLELQEFSDGLDGLLRQAAEWDGDDLLLAEPYWLQDDVDGMCFGPAGFSECGDATLWHVRRRSQWKKRRLLTRLLRSQEKDWGYALQLLDTAEQQNGDCLVGKKGSLRLGKCSSLEKAWSWGINGEGMLYQQQPQRKLNPTQCLWRRMNHTLPAAVLDSCDRKEQDSSSRLVRFSMVRYHTSAATAAASTIETLEEPLRESQPPSEEEEATTATEHAHVTTVDLAHSHASGPVVHSDLKPSSQLLYHKPLGGKSLSAHMAPRALLKAANPMLMVLDEKEIPPAVEKRPKKDYKLRKMPTHSYIAASKNEIWTDPQTGLEYHTDLCGYLGHDRKESGRHTLAGVGQYMRTVFNIKVYGVAMYVSKRDVLADPLFEPYALLTQEELRDRPDFYSHLRHMPSPLDDRGGLFDRTLLLKLNMQLSTETMRSSLQADWKMLTDERKNLLINSSLKPRPADENMLRKIESDDNPSNCSCGQTAPEEYNADDSCCARGTELVFTWRKNGDLEIRLDGRTMDIFPRPDVAEGIFYEYLRYDDPISVDFRDRVVDGFPFLLAPLAQVRGVSPNMMSPPVTEERHEERGFFKAVGGLADMVSSQTESLTGWVQSSANAMASNAANAAQLAGDTARGIGEEMDRRREVLFRQMAALPESSIQFIAQRIQPHRRAISAMPSWMSDMGTPGTFEKVDQPRKSAAPRGRVFRSPLTHWLGESQEEPLPDEIGPMIHPTMSFTRKVFLAMVHLYLLLLLIVSLPGSPNTLVVRRKPRTDTNWLDDSTSIDRLKRNPESRREKRIETKCEPSDESTKGKIRKSLSYFL